MVYKVGQVFKNGKEYYLLAGSEFTKECCLVNIFTGVFWDTPYEVSNINKITVNELFMIIDNPDEEFELDIVYSRIR